jgi:hypothetical protein
MAADFTVKANSVPGPLLVDLSYADGSALPDLTTPDTVITFRMRPWGLDPAVIDAPATAVGPARVSYQFSPTDLVGLGGAYQAEIDVVWASGRHETFPANPDRPFLVISVIPPIADPAP